MPNVYEPTVYVCFFASEDVFKKEHQLLRQHGKNIGIGSIPIFSNFLIVLNEDEFSECSIQFWRQRAQKLQFNKISPALLIESVRNLDPATPGVEFSGVADGEDRVVINGLHLHVPSASLAAVISFALRHRRVIHSASKAVLNLPEPAKIFARGREIVLMEEFAD
jgi:hypothetical protein